MYGKPLPKAVKVLKRLAARRKLYAFAASLAIFHVIMAVYALPEAGLAWEETQHLSGAKAGAYPPYQAVTGGRAQ